MSDYLKSNLMELINECDERDIAVVLGGGLGLFLKQQTIPEETETLIARNFWPEARTTSDIDVFLSTDVIINPGKVSEFRNILDTLGYKSKTDYWQFAKENFGKPIQIDLLTGPIIESNMETMSLKSHRIKPRGVNNTLHAYYTPCALLFDQDPTTIKIKDFVNSGNSFTDEIKIVNPFSYLIMKLHAMEDRLSDSNKDLGRHHALDIYRIIAMMTEAEFRSVSTLAQKYKDDNYCIKAAKTASTRFGTVTSLGSIRLREHPSFVSSFDLKPLLDALNDIFAQ